MSSPSSLGSFLRRLAVACVLVGLVSATGIVVGNAVSTTEFARAKTVRIPGGVLAPQEKGKAANILLIGSDSRQFVDTPDLASHFGTPADTGAPHSDTMMVLHVEPDEKSGLLVSLPRDLLVDVPGHGRTLLNAAFAYGGPELLIRTISQNFDLQINHYIEVNFVGFEKIVDAIGHVNLYFPTPVHDPYTGLDVEQAGCVSLNGAQALAYARSRHYYVPRNLQAPGPWSWNATTQRASSAWVADGSDIERIPRQQYFLRTLSQAAIDKTSSNVFKVVALLNAVTANFTRDQGLTQDQLKALVRTFRGLDPRTVQMTTIPYTTAPDDPNRVVVKMPDAEPLLERLRSFKIPKGLPTLLPANTIRVRVVNGSGIKGEAAVVQNAFIAHGFQTVGAPADADRSDYPKTQVRYAPDASEKGATVAVMTGTTNLVEAASQADTLGADVLVIVGRDYPGLKSLLKEPAPSTTASTATTATTATTGSGGGAAGSGTTGATSTTIEKTTVDTRYVPVDPRTGGPLVGCPKS